VKRCARDLELRRISRCGSHTLPELASSRCQGPGPVSVVQCNPDQLAVGTLTTVPVELLTPAFSVVEAISPSRVEDLLCRAAVALR
jgi:hypothetical protein